MATAVGFAVWDESKHLRSHGKFARKFSPGLKSDPGSWDSRVGELKEGDDWVKQNPETGPGLRDAAMAWTNYYRMAEIRTAAPNVLQGKNDGSPAAEQAVSIMSYIEQGHSVTSNEQYRGIRYQGTLEQAQAALTGKADVPLASFTGDQALANSFSLGNSGREGDPAPKIARDGSQISVIFHLKPGASVLPSYQLVDLDHSVSRELVTGGQMEYSNQRVQTSQLTGQPVALHVDITQVGVFHVPE